MRYTDLALPRYAFLPGVDPHPTADPRGHSHGRPRPVPLWQPPTRWFACTPYLYGCDLFNAGYFWEAHEAWEGLWQLCARGNDQARYLQGLIQAANGLLKQRMGRATAVQRLRAEARRHLAVVPARFMGLGVREWSHALDAHLADPPAQPFPVLVLENTYSA